MGNAEHGMIAVDKMKPRCCSSIASLTSLRRRPGAEFGVDQKQCRTRPPFRAPRLVSKRRAGAPFGDDHMKFKHMLALLSAAAMSLTLTGVAVAPSRSALSFP